MTETWWEELNLPDISAITIMLDGGPPRIDLGNVAPHVAILVFEQAADLLRDVLQEPEITIAGMDIYDLLDEKFSD